MIDCPPTTLAVGGKNWAGSAGVDDFRSACRALAVFGACAGWGLVVVGVLSGAFHLVEMAGVGFHDLAGWVRAGLRAGSVGLVFVLTGWGVAAFSRITAAAILLYLDRVACVSDELLAQASRGLSLLERIAETIDKNAGLAVSSAASNMERARSMAEIERATKSAEWLEAETRLREFEIAFPDDPRLSSLQNSLASAREGTVRQSLALLDAAREVNDHERVLDIYHDLAPSLEGQQRASVERDLAKWFLSLIHRRLRTGKVQSDVVRLAERFAEKFAATVEGASVRASLPTLRRSVGLCPRCAQPYSGVAEACPQCKKDAGQALLATQSNNEMDLPE
jgi:hypothetical protein